MLSEKAIWMPLVWIATWDHNDIQGLHGVGPTPYWLQHSGEWAPAPHLGSHSHSRAGCGGWSTGELILRAWEWENWPCHSSAIFHSVEWMREKCPHHFLPHVAGGRLASGAWEQETCTSPGQHSRFGLEVWCSDEASRPAFHPARLPHG